MKKVYFVRHSIRDFTSRDDREVPLTIEGVKLAEKLKPIFINERIKNIYSSPYLRAIQTIKPTADILDVQIKIEEELREREVGKWVDNFSEFSINQWHDFDFKLSNGESLNEVKQRMIKTYTKIINQEDSNIIISGHGTSLAILFNEILAGDFGLKEFNQMKMP
ncbi:MAG: histidine phosphatase family protein, partial [Vagococcus sp.]